jgi:hypothetical protein
MDLLAQPLWAAVAVFAATALLIYASGTMLLILG